MPRLHAPAALKLDIYFAGISPGENGLPCPEKKIRSLLASASPGESDVGRGGREKKKRKEKKRGEGGYPRDTYNVINVTLNCRFAFQSPGRIILVDLKIHG